MTALRVPPPAVPTLSAEVLKGFSADADSSLKALHASDAVVSTVPDPSVVSAGRKAGHSRSVQNLLARHAQHFTKRCNMRPRTVDRIWLRQ